MMPTAVSSGWATLSRDRAAEQDGGAGKDEQRQRVAEAPGQPVLDDIGDMAAARGDAGDGGDMIGLERMLHAQQKPQPQNSEHTPLPVVSVHQIPVGSLCQVKTSSNRLFIEAQERRSACSLYIAVRIIEPSAAGLVKPCSVLP